MKMQILRAAVVGLASLATSASAGAAVITTDVVPQSGGGWFSSQISDFGPYNREAENISNDSFDTNLSNNPDDGPGHTSDPNDSMWLTKVPGVGGSDTDPFIIVDLGAEYIVNGFHIWNYNELGGNTNRGVRLADVYSSTGDRTNAGDGPPEAGTFALRQSFEFAQAPGTNGYTGTAYTFTTPFTTRYVKFDINSSWGADGFGLSEVQFDGTPVPEPSSLGGLLAIGAAAALRRRRRA